MNMTTRTFEDFSDDSAEPDLGDRPSPAQQRTAILPIAAAVILAFVAAAWWGTTRDDGSWETADFSGQGSDDSVYAANGARMLRRADALSVFVDVPTPLPSTYEYPTSDQHPPWAAPHPTVSPGSGDAPEVFTLWAFIFNDASLCTDGQCDLDDLGPDTAARGGSYQVDGRVADDDRLRFEGSVRLGQPPSSGSHLDSPDSAELHLAIAPHGRVRTGSDLWRQLNGPLGDPSLWWAATFLPDT